MYTGYIHMHIVCCFYFIIQMFDWDQDNVIVTGSSDGIVRVCMYTSPYSLLCLYLLDIPRQPTCMKLGTRELYQPIQSFHVICLGISNKSVAVPRQDSICPALQHMYVYMYVYFRCGWLSM